MKHSLKPMLLVLFIGMTLLGTVRRSWGEDKSDSSIKQRAIQAWQDKRFGMFIHWGPVSLKGTEIGWSRGVRVPVAEYDQLYKLINNRGYQGESSSGDSITPEQKVGGFNRKRPWKTCMTISKQWTWKPNDKLKSRKQCIQTLIHTVGGDGNLLLNVGPMPDGRIEPRQVERLIRMNRNNT